MRNTHFILDFPVTKLYMYVSLVIYVIDCSNLSCEFICVINQFENGLK